MGGRGVEWNAETRIDTESDCKTIDGMNNNEIQCRQTIDEITQNKRVEPIEHKGNLQYDGAPIC